MMKRTTCLICAVAVSSMLAACDKKDAEETDLGKTKPAATAEDKDEAEDEADQDEVKEVELSDDDVPVPEDFIEKATEEIDKENAKAELDKLEEEIASGK